MCRFDGDRLYYGPKETDWVGFIDPIIGIKFLMDKQDIRVFTESSEYILCSINDARYMRVIRIIGKSLKHDIVYPDGMKDYKSMLSENIAEAMHQRTMSRTYKQVES